MIASVLPLIFVVTAIVVLGVTGNLLSASPIVIAAQAAALGLAIWARRSFQKGAFRVAALPAGSAIIRIGPYRVVRHPMYAAVLLLIWAGVLSHLSAFTLAVGVLTTALIIARVFSEERLLRARYPDYDDYSRTTKALVPYVF